MEGNYFDVEAKEEHGKFPNLECLDADQVEYVSRIRDGAHMEAEFESFINKYADIAKDDYNYNFGSISHNIERKIDDIRAKYNYAYKAICNIKEFIESNVNRHPKEMPSGKIHYPISYMSNINKYMVKSEDYKKEVHDCFMFYMQNGGVAATFTPILEMYEKYSEEYKRHLQLMLHFVEDNSNLTISSELKLKK